MSLSLRSLLLLACCSFAAAEWTFSGGKATIASKGDPVGSSTSFDPSKPLASSVPLGPKDILKLSFTLKDGDTAGRPHQAFLLVKDSQSELETYFPLTVKGSSGKAKVDIPKKHPLAPSRHPELDFTLVLGSFGSSTTPGSLISIGKITPVIDPSAKAALETQRKKDFGEGNVVYKPKDEIRHIFRPDPKSPSKIITLVFLLAVIAGYAGLFGVWFPVLGANFKHFPKAIRTAPLSHPLFLVSLLSLEGIFFMYYTSWNLFQTLPAVGLVGVIAFLSGSRALREVRARRERGER
ncbi:Oligosaccharyltransferase subunit Ribophorin II-domain-containing protein [Trichophaea hybrida]|nr:Oligosaccharyltransferase subunit Ribophorin II-domain-containing protein [Trichophaea hybrida]